MTHAGGAATTGGVTFQQRVAAWVMACALANVDVGPTLGLPGPLAVRDVRFETAHKVDDLAVTGRDGETIMLQVKTSVDLSTRPSADFVSAIGQFVAQYSSEMPAMSRYVLMTSSRASRSITFELRKILDAVRAGDEQFAAVPFSGSEQRTLAQYRAVVDGAFAACGDAAPPAEHEARFRRFSQRVHVATLDFGRGTPAETAAQVLLASVARGDPALLWTRLTDNALAYAAGRLVVTAETLRDDLTHLLAGAPRAGARLGSATEAVPQTSSVRLDGPFPTGKEVLLLRPVEPGPSHVLYVGTRFGATGKRRFRFTGDTVTLPTGERVPVVRRCATVQGLLRLVEAGLLQDRGDNPEFEIIEEPDTRDAEATEMARQHAALCRQLVAEQAAIEGCVHCLEWVDERHAHVVEIDADDAPHVIGLAHSDCLRATDRVLGSAHVAGAASEVGNNATNGTLPPGFDARRWAELLMTGQGLWNELDTFGNVPVRIAWNGDEAADPGYSFCVALDVEDGSVQYITRRGKTVRLTRGDAEQMATAVRHQIRIAQAAGDPLAITSHTRKFAAYSELVRSGAVAGETIATCVDARAVRYSALLARAYDAGGQYYAPVCALRDPETEIEVAFGDRLVVITDPLRMGEFDANWRRAGVTPARPWRLHVIDTDAAFDAYMRRATAAGLGVIVDPLLDLEGRVVRGVCVDGFSELIRSGGGDLVREAAAADDPLTAEPPAT